jgi:hypothetical protein
MNLRLVNVLMNNHGLRRKVFVILREAKDRNELPAKHATIP